MATGHLLQEVRCMKLVQHPNVVRLYEVIDTPCRLYLILELGDGGDLYDYILRHEGGVAEGVARVLFAQIVRAVAYCHRLHVVHRDLKPENVVLFNHQGVKITDFGFSSLFQPGAMLSTSCGSLAYSAPEILLGEAYDAPSVDIWSLGVILYMLVCGHPPFQEFNDSETLIRIMDCRYATPTHVSQHCQDLISRMLQRAPCQRAPLQEIEGHPWLQGVDPAPHGSSTPLSSHFSLTPEEHQSILHAMVSRHIADQDIIQQALEADLYNHITATYYLLGERILGDKQDRPPQLSQTPLLPSLGLQDRGFHHGAVRGALPSGSAHRGLSGSGKLLAARPLLQLGPPENPLSEYTPVPCQVLSLHPTPPDPPLKSLGALQLICEEEEEEEEEEEAQLLRQGLLSSKVQTTQAGVTTPSAPGGSGGPQSPARPALGQEEGARQLGPLERSLTEEVDTVVVRKEQEEMEDQNEQKEECTMEEEVSQNREEDDLHEPAVQEPEMMRSEFVSMSDTSEPLKVRSGNHVTADQPISGVDNQVNTVVDPPPPSPCLEGVVQCCRGQWEMPNWDPSSSVLENNNNTAAKPSQSCSLSRNHCVDLGTDGVEARRVEVPSTKGEDGGNTEEGLHLARSDYQNAPPDMCVAKEAGCEAALRVEPGKGKKLRERLLKLPLCEKALSFNIQPTSKEKLQPFAQYNCCHVL
ncbi:SNF related kinase b isoform X2 [Hypomesus transpacificus]|nr:SNF related kinase b isoform X2 [Hypomesus transpacificus]